MSWIFHYSWTIKHDKTPPDQHPEFLSSPIAFCGFPVYSLFIFPPISEKKNSLQCPAVQLSASVCIFHWENWSQKLAEWWPLSFSSTLPGGLSSSRYIIKPLLSKISHTGTIAVPDFWGQGIIHLITESPMWMKGGKGLEKRKRGREWKYANIGRASPHTKSDISLLWKHKGWLAVLAKVASSRTVVINTLQTQTTRDTAEVELVGFLALCN